VKVAKKAVKWVGARAELMVVAKAASWVVLMAV